MDIKQEIQTHNRILFMIKITVQISRNYTINGVKTVKNTQIILLFHALLKNK